MGEMGFLGSYFPEQYGGAGLDVLSYVIVVEEVSKACGSSGVLISAHTSLANNPIYAFGTEQQKQKWLPPLNRGRDHRLPPVDRAERRQRRRRNCHHVQAGRRRVCHQRQQDLHHQRRLSGNRIVLASFDRSLKHKGISAFIVDLKSPGVTVLKNENKMGIRGTYTTAFGLDNLRVPAENLLGKEGKGFNIAMDTLNGGRIGIAAQALGIAEGAFERALSYSKERKQFDRRISEFQAIQFKLADMYARIEASKLMTYKAAWLKENKMTYTLDSALCKMVASEAATYVTKEAIQILGGYGYICDYEVERMFRDAKITEIYEGTNEVQRLVISKALLS